MNKKLIWKYKVDYGDGSVDFRFYDDGTIDNSLMSGTEPEYMSTLYKIEDGFLFHRRHDQEQWIKWETHLEECSKYGFLLQAYIANELEKAMLI